MLALLHFYTGIELLGQKLSPTKSIGRIALKFVAAAAQGSFISGDRLWCEDQQMCGRWSLTSGLFGYPHGGSAVGARAANENVISRSADQRVIAGAAAQDICNVIADEAIVKRRA